MVKLFDKLTTLTPYLILAFFLEGCLGTAYLKKDEKLLFAQKFVNADELEQDELYAQLVDKPNKRLFALPIAPYVWIHQIGKSAYDKDKYLTQRKKSALKYDKKISKARKEKRKLKLLARKNKKTDKVNKNIKEGNLLMRWGEPVAVYSPQKEQQEKLRIQSYLITQGYFGSEVDVQVKETGKLVTVNYSLDLKLPYVISQTKLLCGDKRMISLLTQHSDETYLKENEVYRQSSLMSERERLTSLLRDNGYYGFDRQYINFQVDTFSLENNQAVIYTRIDPPPSGVHRRYVVDSVVFITDVDEFRSGNSYSESYNGVTYLSGRRKYSKKVLDWRNFIYPGMYYSRELTLQTQAQLSNLDMFQYVNIRYDTSGGLFLARISTNPAKKFQTSNELGVDIVSQNQAVPGPFINLGLKNRNTFRGLEKLDLNGYLRSIPIASVIDDDVRIDSSYEYGASIAITIPQFLFPLNPSYKKEIGKYNPTTRIKSGMQFIQRPEYIRRNVNASIGYNWQNKNFRYFSLVPIELGLIETPFKSPQYDSLLRSLQARGNNLINSFNSALISNSNFTLTLNFNNYGLANTLSKYFKFYLESGGNIARWLGIDSLAFNTELEHYQYVKSQVDYRFNHPINHKHSVATRIHFGLAYPYADNNTLPYEKFFFAGGSNSIRAWKPRRLGPGSYTPLDSLNDTYNTSLEQPGTMILETSIEYRHPLFGFLEGGIFVDIGNTWNINGQGSRPGSDFKWNRFYKEMAIGAGYGFRFNFSFLILRLDWALKIYDPARSSGNRFVWNSGFKDSNGPFAESQDYQWNLGIGYPF